jgi:hypothetical protein
VFRRCYVGWINGIQCYVRYPGYPPETNLLLSAAFNLGQFLDFEPNYEAALLNYAVGARALEPPVLGFAGENWLDGTQSGIWSFITPTFVAQGYGLTTTMIHEYGHPLGLSHPHDGYDPASGTMYDPTGETYFAWVGDESNTMTSYLDLNWDFSQFDRDNSARHHAAGYALVANRIAAEVLVAPGAEAAAADLEHADDELLAAQAALAEHDYLTLLDRAQAAYWAVRAAADRAGVPVLVRQPSTWTVLPPPGPEARASRISPGSIDLDPRANHKRQSP